MHKVIHKHTTPQDAIPVNAPTVTTHTPSPTTSTAPGEVPSSDVQREGVAGVADTIEADLEITVVVEIDTEGDTTTTDKRYHITRFMITNPKLTTSIPPAGAMIKRGDRRETCTKIYTMIIRNK